MNQPTIEVVPEPEPQQQQQQPPPPQQQQRTSIVRPKTNDPRSNLVPNTIRQRPTPIQTAGVRTNLITVPIQDSGPTMHETAASSAAVTTHTYYNQYPQTANYTQTLPPMHIPPPPPPQQQQQYYTAPPTYSPAQTYPAYTATTPTAPPPPTQYPSPQGAPPNRQATQYDYTTAPPPQWTANQQYYR